MVKCDNFDIKHLNTSFKDESRKNISLEFRINV